MSWSSADLHKLQPDELRKYGRQLSLAGGVAGATGIALTILAYVRPAIERERGDSAVTAALSLGWLLLTIGVFPLLAGLYMLLLSHFREGVFAFYRFVGRAIGFSLAGLLIWWAGYTFVYAPNSRQSPHQESSSGAVNDSARQAEAEVLALVGDDNARFQLLQGYNAEVYIPRSRFEAVPFPDREGYVATLGRSWCSQVDHTYLPTLSVRDIRTGEELAVYSCFSKSATLRNLNGWFR